MTWIAQIALTALIAALIELLEHYLPWRLIIRRDLPRPWAYIMGVAGLALPVSILLLQWIKEWAGVALDPGQVVMRCLVALWAVILAGGLAVLSGYGLDWALHKAVKVQELEELVRHHENQG